MRTRFDCVVLLLILALITPRAAFAVDTSDVLQSMLPSDRIPRVLNSDDIVLNPNDPEPLFTPSGDFNKDGIDDIAISGIYVLEKGPNRYFLLVAAVHTDPVRYDKLFYGEYDKPVFLHQPGTTGEFDPGTQAFSVTSCSSCTDGQDFVWNPKKKTLDRRGWEQRRREYKVVQHRPEREPDPEKIDAALKIVGALPDVVGYVEELRRHKGTLGTSARFPAPPLRTPDYVEIDIYEKKGEKEIVYDTFDVNVASATVVKRGKKIKPAGAASNTSR
jgi:hypothetical protein